MPNDVSGDADAIVDVGADSENDTGGERHGPNPLFRKRARGQRIGEIQQGALFDLNYVSPPATLPDTPTQDDDLTPPASSRRVQSPTAGARQFDAKEFILKLPNQGGAALEPQNNTVESGGNADVRQRRQSDPSQVPTDAQAVLPGTNSDEHSAASREEVATAARMVTEDLIQLRIGWWNIEHLSSAWCSATFWDILKEFDVVFLTETHHVEIPIHAGWHIVGIDQEADAKAGGCLACVRRNGLAKVLETWTPFDGYVWIRIAAAYGPPIWLGGAYIPGPSDPRFRSLQGDGKSGHFDAVGDQLQGLSGSIWVLGGDFNSQTGSS